MDLKLAPVETIAVVAALISFGSLLVAFMSYRESRKALRITEAEFNERNLSVHAYLIDSFAFQENGRKYCTFAISFTNQSSSPRSFSTLELEVEFYDEDGVYGKAIAAPDEIVIPLGLQDKYKRLDAPLNLASKETTSGWITFLLPASSHRKFRIDSYKVSGRTADGHESFVEAYLLRMVTDAEEDKNR